jgi:hypothetical protein
MDFKDVCIFRDRFADKRSLQSFIDGRSLHFIDLNYFDKEIALFHKYIETYHHVCN